MPGGRFSTDVMQHFRMTDNEVTAGLLDAAFNEAASGHLHARRIVARAHFKVIYERKPDDVRINPEAGAALFRALSNEFEASHFRHDRYHKGTGAPDFPVRLRDGQVVSSLAISDTLNHVPIVSVDYIFAERSIISQAIPWLKAKRAEIIKPNEEEGDHG
jgi:hypothetical protein